MNSSMGGCSPYYFLLRCWHFLVRVVSSVEVSVCCVVYCYCFVY
jgi:hypothetical protein